MCGIVGVAGNLSIKDDKAFRTMLVLDSVRGEDSTGVAVVNRQGRVSVAKEVGNPFNLFDTKRYESAVRGFNTVMIGHNRWATSGDIIRKNAHPFEFDTLVGVHNGTLKNKYKLDDAAAFKVDSENLYHHIEKHSLEDAIGLLDGAWALVWFDKINFTLNMLRNKERPLYVSRSTDGNNIYWASEKWMIDVACSREGLNVSEPGLTPVDMHIEFPMDQQFNIGKPKITEVKSNFVPFVQPVGAGNNYNNGWHNGVFRGHNNNTNNVVALPNVVNEADRKGTTARNTEKKGVTSAGGQSPTLSESLIGRYCNKKDLALTITGDSVDKNRATYLILQDEFYPYLAIRMYVSKKSKLLGKIGTTLMCDVGAYHTIAGDGSFFKATFNENTFVNVIDEPKCLYDNGKGQLLTKEEWEETFSNCAGCFDALFAEDHGNRLAKLGNGQYECFCGTCSANPEYTQDFNLKTVY